MENKDDDCGVICQGINAAGDVLAAGASSGAKGVQEDLIGAAVDFVGDLFDPEEDTEKTIKSILKRLQESKHAALILDWAHARNIVKGSTAKDQYLKLISEVGELAIAQAEADEDKIIDGIGDCFVVLAIIAAQLDVNLEISIGKAIVSEEVLSVDNFHFLLFVSHLGGLSDAISKNDEELQEHFIGQSIAVLAHVANSLDFDINSCIEAAYHDIKDRKGVMYNGVFVKSNDSRYGAILKELGRGEE